MLDTGIFSFRVLSDENGINIVIRRLESLDGDAGPDVGEEVEGSTQSQVERNMALPDCPELRSFPS